MSSNVSFKPAGHATLIGSLPVKDHAEALALIFSHIKEIPLWPQLPSKSSEGMLVQFLEGMPGIIETEDKSYFNIESEGFAEEQLAFFEEYLAVAENPDLLADSRFSVSKDRANGVYLFIEQVKSRDGFKALKGQVTGPFTLLTGLTDQNKRLGYYDPTIREIVVKAISLKSGWQAQMLKNAGYQPIIFIDEPALAGLGSSAFISIALDDIKQDLTEVFDAVHQQSGLVGVHVCANTDWNLLLSLDLDIISFDAYGFFDRFVTCENLIKSFLGRGGIIAWGIIPTSEEEHITGETADSLVKKWEEQAGMLVDDKWDLPALLNQTLITPSCGTGSLSLELATRVLELTRDVSHILRQKYLP